MKESEFKFSTPFIVSLNFRINPNNADDIGAEKASEWTISKLMEIINTRLENKLITIVNTNFSPNQLINRFEKGVEKIAAQRLVGRMVDNVHILNLNTIDYHFKGSISSN